MIQGFKHFIQQEDISDVFFDDRILALYQRAVETLKLRLGFSWVKTAVTNELHDPESMVFLKYLPILRTPVPVVLEDSTALTVNEDFWVYDNYIYIPDITATDPLTVDVSYTGGYLESDAGFRPYSQMLYELMKYWIQLQDTTQPGAFIDYRIPREVDQMIIDTKVYNL